MILILFGLCFFANVLCADEKSGLYSALTNDPDNCLLYNQLGLIQVKLGELTNAGYSFKKSVRVCPSFADGYYNLGLVRLSLGDYNAAIENFIRATVFSSNHIDANINLGNLYNLRNDLEQAQYYYMRAGEINPADADVLNNLGLLQLKDRNYGSAVKILEQAWSLKKDEDIKYNLAVAYYYNKQSDALKALYPHVNPENKHYQALISILGN